LIDALFARTRSFGIGQTVYFSFININISIKQILLTCFILFPISCLQTEGSSQRILYSETKVVYLARCETQDLYNTDTSDHRRTGRHFTGGAEEICPENNNLL